MDKNITNIIAPPAVQIDSNYLKVGEKYSKTIFVFTYPRYLNTGWFSGIVDMPELLDISIFIHPIETPLALKRLRKKAAQVESQVIERQQKGRPTLRCVALMNPPDGRLITCCVRPACRRRVERLGGDPSCRRGSDHAACHAFPCKWLGFRGFPC